MQTKASTSSITGALLFAVFLWGGSNTGVKFLVETWPPLFTGSTRFIAAGVLMLLTLEIGRRRGTAATPALSSSQKRQLWSEAGLSLALYVVAFYWALKLTSVTHVALYLGASPMWALLWEGRPSLSWKNVQRYGAASLALTGVMVLFWPTLQSGGIQLLGELCGLAASVLWTNYGRLARKLSSNLSPTLVTAHSMWRAGVIVAPLALLEILMKPVVVTAPLLGVQLFCIICGGVIPFWIWNYALRQWPTSQVYIFNNAIPLSTMAWAHILLDEPISPTFWMAMALIALALAWVQIPWSKLWNHSARQ